MTTTFTFEAANALTPLLLLFWFPSLRSRAARFAPLGGGVPANSEGRRGALLVVVGLGCAGVAAILAGSGGGALPRPRGGGHGGRDDHRRAGVDFEDPEAKDAVGDLQVVVERVEQVARGLEPHPAVVGLG